MARPIVVTAAVQVPARALSVTASRAGGPGGQNVNKVATRVDLRVELGAIEGLSEAARARLRALARHRLDAEGRLRVTSQATRDQSRNLEIAREKVRDLVAAALPEPRRRRPTRVPTAAREHRLASKKLRSHLKQARTKRQGWD